VPWDEVRAHCDSIADGMPGMLIQRKDHVGIDEEGLASFHDRLIREGELPTPAPGSQGRVPFSREKVLGGLRDTYVRWNRVEIWTVAKQWLQSVGIDTTGY
jgi:hypothetical protein